VSLDGPSSGGQPDGAGTITAVIVSYDTEPDEIRATLDSLLAQTRAPAEILIVDNGAGGPIARELRGYAAELRTIASGANLGYNAAVNLAAANSNCDYLLCLNPDARAEAGCIEQLASVSDADATIALAGAQILLEDGLTRNAGANPLHPTGISPSGGYGEPREQGPPRDVAVVSGACCLMRRASLLALGGLVEELFLYYDDVDLAWRARIAGMRVVYCPAAVVRHDYEFARRGRKWFFLERNRVFGVLSNYEARTLILLSPLLVVCEIGLLAVATRSGWLKQKLASYGSLLALRRRLLSQRRAVKASRQRTDVELLELFTDRLDSALLSARATALANAVCVPYLLVLRRLLRPASPGLRPSGRAAQD
jgi:GT2 family glycosyltransferase